MECNVLIIECSLLWQPVPPKVIPTCESMSLQDRNLVGSVEYSDELSLLGLWWQVGSQPYVTPVREYTDLARRYPNLIISPDFTRMVSCWTSVSAHPADPLHLSYPARRSVRGV